MEIEMEACTRVNEWTMIPVDKLVSAIECPFERQGITKEMVQESIRTGSYGLASESYSHGTRLPVERSPEWHAQRVAYLVRYGWERPLEIDVGIPSVGFAPYPLQDGHHRLCAAIVRGDTHIRAEVSGALDYAFQLFGVDCSLYGEPEVAC